MDYLRGLVMKSDAVTVEGYILGLSEERREAELRRCGMGD